MENEHPDDVLRNLNKKRKEKDKWRKINYARYTMQVISALLIFSAAFMLYNWSSTDLIELEKGAYLVLCIMLAFALIYIGLSIWAKSQPKYAIIVAIAVFVVPHLLEAIESPSEIFSGLWWKIIILSLFIRGLFSVKTLDMKTVNDELLDDF